VLTYPEGVPGRKNPFWLFNRLPIDEAAAPVVESRREP